MAHGRDRNLTALRIIAPLLASSLGCGSQPASDPPITLQTTPATLDFGTEASTLDVQVMNTGATAVEIRRGFSAPVYVDGAQLGQVAPGGSTALEGIFPGTQYSWDPTTVQAGETITFPVTLDRNALLDVGNFRSSLSFTARKVLTEDPTVEIAGGDVLFSVTNALFAQDRLHFGQQTTTMETNLLGRGPGTLTWTATPDGTWISVSPAQGTGDATLSVTINRTGMLSAPKEIPSGGTCSSKDPTCVTPPPTHYGFIEIASNFGARRIRVAGQETLGSAAGSCNCAVVQSHCSYNYDSRGNLTGTVCSCTPSCCCATAH